MRKHLNINRTISLLLILFFIGCCKAPDNNSNKEPKEVQPIWVTDLEADGIWNRGLIETPIYGNCVIFHATVKKSVEDNIEDNRLCGLNIETGEIEWWFPSDFEKTYNEQFDSKGYIYNNYLVTKSLSRGSLKETEEVLCFDLDTQQEIWRKDFSPKFDRSERVLGNNNICYFDQAEEIRHGGRSYIYSADILTGDTTLIYTVKLEVPNYRLGKIFNLYENNLIFYTRESGNDLVENYINIIDLKTNSLIHKILIPDKQETIYNVNSSIVHNNRLYIGIAHYTICYNMTDWTIVWENYSKYNAPYLDLQNGVLFRSGSNEYEGLDAITGRRLYAREMGAFWAYLNGNYAYVLDRRNRVQIIDLKTGEILDTLICSEKDGWHIGPKPIVKDGRLYIISYTSAYCYPAYPWDKK